ncbi:MAG: 1-deoxy-D-xylulose-5-phosphate synthase [Chloroflexota bacterium]|nr:MAG: 1-deoxy-D-xylulose-5-phosphate synthase [Chloroflexota bacterium]
MRAAFAETLAEIAATDRRVLLLTGDLGFMALESFQQRFPDRFINAGVAEQNMVGVATGLAEGGYIPFVYSIVTFATLRPYEFIRNGPVYHHLPVRVVGIGGGFEYGTAGATHHGLDDLAVMRAMHGMAIVAPADPAQTRAAILATWNLPGPIYYRLGKDDRAVVDGLDGRFRFGRVEQTRRGADVALVATGAISQAANGAADLLASEGIGCEVAVVAMIAPPPVDDLHDLLSRHRRVVTVEAHGMVGGLGSLVAEVAADSGWGGSLARVSVGAPSARTGSQRSLEAAHGLSPAAIAARARAMVDRAR